jgi:hypothetical protein
MEQNERDAKKAEEISQTDNNYPYAYFKEDIDAKNKGLSKPYVGSGSSAYDQDDRGGDYEYPDNPRIPVGYLGGTDHWEGDDDHYDSYTNPLSREYSTGNISYPQSDIEQDIGKKVEMIRISPYTYTQTQPRKNLLELSGVLRAPPLSNQTQHTPGGHPLSKISVSRHKSYGVELSPLKGPASGQPLLSQSLSSTSMVSIYFPRKKYLFSP